MDSATAPQDLSTFFYYLKGDPINDISADIELALIQPKRSLFYYRSAGAGIQEYENLRTNLQIQIGLKYDIIMAISERNARVPDGSTAAPDSRAAASQASIDIDVDGDNTNVVVRFIPIANLRGIQSISIPIGARK